MDSNNLKEKELEEKASKIKEIYRNSVDEINNLGNRALSILRDIRKKREQKKIQNLTKELID